MQRILRGSNGDVLNHEDTLQRLRSEGGGGTSPLSRSGIPIAHDRRPPIDLLCSLFPYKRSMLQQILDSCNNDITQALEQVLSLYGDQRGAPLLAAGVGALGAFGGIAGLGGSLVAGGGGGAVVTGSAASAASGGPCAGGLPGSHPPVPSSLTSPASLFGQTYLTAPLGSASHAIKSAFSPITVPPTAHLNSIRYTYGAAAAAAAAASGRSMALMPFPHLLPGLTTLGSGYPGYGSLPNAAAANKAFHYAAMCSCCTGKPFGHHVTPRDKTTGCIGE